MSGAFKRANIVWSFIIGKNLRLAQEGSFDLQQYVGELRHQRVVPRENVFSRFVFIGGDLGE